jgi:2-aminobenzoate-CoA ligase
VRDWTGIPELAYPERLNCAAELLDRMVESGAGDRLVFRFPGGTWTYRHLFETSNRIAHVLVDELGLVPGNRVLLRGPNNPMLAACWFAVLKAGGVVVCTMPLAQGTRAQVPRKKG